MQSKAPTVEAYLKDLPEDRRVALQAVRKVILDNLDDKYQECMQYGMIGYSVPHSVYPAGYHCDPKQPLPFAGIASQKNHMSLYLMCMYDETALSSKFRAAWQRTGKKLDMGKCCIRFKRLDDVALDVVGAAIRDMPADRWIEIYEAALSRSGRRVKTGAKSKPAPAAKKSAAKSKSAAPKRAASKKATRKTKTAGRKA